MNRLCAADIRPHDPRSAVIHLFYFVHVRTSLSKKVAVAAVRIWLRTCRYTWTMMARCPHRGLNEVWSISGPQVFRFCHSWREAIGSRQDSPLIRSFSPGQQRNAHTLEFAE